MSAVSITLPTIQSSTYDSSFDFITLAEYQGNIYGVKSDGIYLITGDTDNGASITCTIETGLAQFQDTSGAPVNRRIRGETIMYYGISDAMPNINITSDDIMYSYSPDHISNREKNRCRLARGHTGFYWHIEMVGTAPFEVYQLDMIAYDTGRYV
jgi:hypothetical protein